MPDAERPGGATDGRRGGPPADVLVWGSDHERRPDLGRRRTALLLGLAAVALGAVVLSQRDGSAPPERSDLRLVETGGGYSTQWGYGGRLDVSLPVVIRNEGPAMTVASVALEGTEMAQPALDVALTEGGRLPLTLRQSRACAAGPSVPPDAALQLEVRRGTTAQTRRLPLPDGVVHRLTQTLAQQCRSVPLGQALVLRTEEAGGRADTVDLLVQAGTVGSAAVRLLSVDAATGLQVRLASPVVLPHVLSQDTLALRLTVSVTDCRALPPADKLDAFGVADVTYDGGLGERAGKAVAGDFPALRELVRRTC